MPSDFEIVVDAQAARDLKHLARTHNQHLPRIRKAIDSLGGSPYEGKPLKGSKAGCYSLREGGFRIVCEVHPGRRMVHLIRIADRKDVYR